MGRSHDDDRRQTDRLKTFEPVKLSDANGEVRAHILNVSKTGGLIHADPTPEVGKIVRANLMGEWHVGNVVWSAAPRFGLLFSIKLSSEKLARLTRQR